MSNSIVLFKKNILRTLCVNDFILKIFFKLSEQHDKVLQLYSEKWESYKEVYEERPLAQVARKLKLEAANLDMKGTDCIFCFLKFCRYVKHKSFSKVLDLIKHKVCHSSSKVNLFFKICLYLD